MNNLKKTALAISLLIPTQSAFAGFSGWLQSAQNGVKKAWNCTSGKVVDSAKSVRDAAVNHPFIAAGSALTIGTAAALITKYKTQISNFGKNQTANVHNKYSELKEKYDNLDNAKKSRIKKTAIATGAISAAGLTGYLAYKYNKINFFNF